jgi:hypothetical protein
MPPKKSKTGLSKRPSCPIQRTQSDKGIISMAKFHCFQMQKVLDELRRTLGYEPESKVAEQRTLGKVAEQRTFGNDNDSCPGRQVWPECDGEDQVSWPALSGKWVDVDDESECSDESSPSPLPPPPERVKKSKSKVAPQLTAQPKEPEHPPLPVKLAKPAKFAVPCPVPPPPPSEGERKFSSYFSFVSAFRKQHPELAGPNFHATCKAAYASLKKESQ